MYTYKKGVNWLEAKTKGENSTNYNFFTCTSKCVDIYSSIHTDQRTNF